MTPLTPPTFKNPFHEKLSNEDFTVLARPFAIASIQESLLKGFPVCMTPHGVELDERLTISRHSIRSLSGEI